MKHDGGCSECRYWMATPATDYGECRRYAPRPPGPTVHGGEPDPVVWWPRTYPFDLCGEYAPLSGA